jgi:hypothetical protein
MFVEGCHATPCRRTISFFLNIALPLVETTPRSSPLINYDFLSSAARGSKLLSLFKAKIVTFFRTTSAESLETVTIPALPREVIIPGTHGSRRGR